MIQLQRRKIKTKFKSPSLNFSEVEQEIELRKDPLTERWCRINVERVKRLHPIKKDEEFEEVIEISKESCPFCSNQIERLTPKFAEFEERLKFGDSILFPNLYPYGKYHAVVILSAKKHYISLDKMSKRLLFDSFMNSIKFFKLVNEKDSSFVYPSINFNYMPPAAASIFHPHLQILIDSKPTSATNLLIKKSLEYFKKERSNFWLDLIDLEKKSKRFIGKKGNFFWIADFSPLKNNQVSGIDMMKSSLTDLNKKEIEDLSQSLSVLFKKFWAIGVRSLTLSTFSGPIGRDISDYFLLNLKLLSRPSLAKYYTSDIGFMELLHQESVVETLPEDVAKSLRFFR